MIGTELGRQLRSLLALIGQPPELRLSPEVFPVVNAFNLDDPPYHTKLGGCCALTAGPVAGEIAQYAIGLPRVADGGDPRRRVVVRYATLGAGAISTPTCGFADALQVEPTLAAVVAPSWDQGLIDPDNTVRQAAALVRQGTDASDLLAASSGQRAAWRIAPANADVMFIGPFELGPGMYFVWCNPATNQQSFASVYWDEYIV